MRAERHTDVGAAAEIARALEACSRLGPEEPGLVVVVPLRPALGACQAYARLAAAGGPAILWDVPGQGGWSFAGSGETWRFDATGAGRIDRTRTQADAWLRDVRLCAHPACEGFPRPRVFGGLAFREGERRAGPWRDFADASFVMPRWLYGRSGDRAMLWLAVRASELADRAALVREAAAVARLLEGDAGAPATPPGGRSRACVAAMSPEAWAGLVGGALDRIRTHGLDKVVTAMHSRVLSVAPIDVAGLLARMGAEYPDCTRFAFTRDLATFVGATPERLVEQAGLSVEVDALAGSIRRRATEDAEAVRRLLGSEKDRREHALVVEAVAGALRPLCKVLEVPGAPRVKSLRNVHHLWSPVRATRASAGHVLDLVARLHPTPAVCGTPREAALGWIAAHEPMQRGWYAGAVGWFDGAGDGSFAVAIRSGVVERHQAWLYAGAGIVEGSDPAAEYAEVRTKQAPMLSALGVTEGALP